MSETETRDVTELQLAALHQSSSSDCVHAEMPFRRFVEVGRVVYIAEGPDSGKIASIVDIIDQNRAVLDGPSSGVNRQCRRFNEMHLTDFVVKIQSGASTHAVRNAWATAEVDKKWNTTSWAKRIEAREKRASLTDLERFKVGKAKQARNRLVRNAFTSLKRLGSKSKKVARDNARVIVLRNKAKASKAKK